jgi:hypothetical protein
VQERTNLRGSYVRRGLDILTEKANRGDARDRFYRAMLRHETYEAYLADVGSVTVEISGYKANPITGRMEILYARRRGWIRDAQR